MSLDWTAATFSVLVAVIGALFTTIAILVKREVDQQRERALDFERRLKAVENDHSS